MDDIAYCFAVSIVLVTCLMSCVYGNNGITPVEAADFAKDETILPYIIKNGDQLEIKFFYNPELNEAVTVRPDGKISLQLIDEIQASGISPSQLDQQITERYEHVLKEPMITVIVRSFSGQRIYVGGEVNQPGLLTLPPGMTALQAVIQAGGFRETAQPKETVIIRKGERNRPVPIRLDLNAALYGNGNGANFQLRPEDIVYVPKSAIAEANQFVNQYIERLLLFRGISFGFTYELNDFRF